MLRWKRTNTCSEGRRASQKHLSVKKHFSVSYVAFRRKYELEKVQMHFYITLAECVLQHLALKTAIKYNIINVIIVAVLNVSGNIVFNNTLYL